MFCKKCGSHNVHKGLRYKPSVWTLVGLGGVIGTLLGNPNMFSQFGLLGNQTYLFCGRCGSDDIYDPGLWVVSSGKDWTDYRDSRGKIHRVWKSPKSSHGCCLGCLILLLLLIAFSYMVISNYHPHVPNSWGFNQYGDQVEPGLPHQ